MEDFKKFVRNHSNLASYVINKKMTWQQFYEIYDLYGENNSIWDNFKDNIDSDISSNNNSPSLVNTFKDLISLFKGIDLKTVQKTLVSLDKAIEAFKGFNQENAVNNYEERPKYHYFED